MCACISVRVSFYVLGSRQQCKTLAGSKEQICSEHGRLQMETSLLVIGDICPSPNRPATCLVTGVILLGLILLLLFQRAHHALGAEGPGPMGPPSSPLGIGDKHQSLSIKKLAITLWQAVCVNPRQL